MHLLILAASLILAAADDDDLLSDPAVIQDLGVVAGQKELTPSQARRYAQIQLQDKGLNGLVSLESRRRLNMSDAQYRHILRLMREAVITNERDMQHAPVQAAVGMDPDRIRQELIKKMRA